MTTARIIKIMYTLIKNGDKKSATEAKGLLVNIIFSSLRPRGTVSLVESDNFCAALVAEYNPQTSGMHYGRVRARKISKQRTNETLGLFAFKKSSSRIRFIAPIRACDENMNDSNRIVVEAKNCSAASGICS
jgi:hypothetical protein